MVNKVQRVHNKMVIFSNKKDLTLQITNKKDIETINKIRSLNFSSKKINNFLCYNEK